MDGARSTDRGMGGSSTSDTLRKLLFDLPGSSGTGLSREMGDIEDIRSRAASGSMNDLSPQELHATLWKVLTFRDNVRHRVPFFRFSLRALGHVADPQLPAE